MLGFRVEGLKGLGIFFEDRAGIFYNIVPWGLLFRLFRQSVSLCLCLCLLFFAHLVVTPRGSRFCSWGPLKVGALYPYTMNPYMVHEP